MLALTSNKVSLEQIFLRLTEAADNDEAKRMLGIKAEETKTDVKIELNGEEVTVSAEEKEEKE